MRFRIAATACAMALLLFVCSGTAVAQGSEAKQSEMKARKGDKEHGEKHSQPEWKPMWQVHKMYLGDMGKVNDLLADAQKALQAGEADKASAKITEAQTVLKQRHDKVHQHMEAQVQKVRESGDEKGAAELEKAWKEMCPAGKSVSKSK